MYANLPKLYHLSITILSAAVFVFYIFVKRSLCIIFDTRLLEYINYPLTLICIRCRLFVTTKLAPPTVQSEELYKNDCLSSAYSANGYDIGDHISIT